jgi:hypothetical protein
MTSRTAGGGGGEGGAVERSWRGCKEKTCTQLEHKEYEGMAHCSRVHMNYYEVVGVECSSGDWRGGRRSRWCNVDFTTSAPVAFTKIYQAQRG